MSSAKFTHEQLQDYKKKLHSSIHWLLIYKEADDYKYFDTYFDALLIKVASLNDLIGHQNSIIDLYSTLLAAKKESENTNCSFKLFRKLVLDAHSILDKVDFSAGGGDYCDYFE